MKKRILFVDDEEMALNGLKRLLWQMSREWEMEFVNNGSLALERMALQPFDVIVSDMRMPAMNGAELLNEVMRRYPKTIRLILSGYADRQLILKCVGSTHQYLAKPCDAKTLTLTVQRAAHLQESMQSELLRQIVTRCVTLPSVPTLYSKIVEALQDPEVSVESIGALLGQDPALTAKIVRMANSSFFGLGHEICSPGEAVTYLGTDSIKSLVLFNDVFSQPADALFPGFTVSALASHSLQVAQAAKVVAEAEEADRKLVDEAYLAGLLHDVGKLVLAANLPAEYKAAIETGRAQRMSVAAAERHTFGADHADLGGYLLGLWGLPAPVVEAIVLHHRPSQALEPSFSPLTAVHIADAFVSPLLPGIPGLRPCELDRDYLLKLNLAGRLAHYKQLWQERKDSGQAG